MSTPKSHSLLALLSCVAFAHLCAAAEPALVLEGAKVFPVSSEPIEDGEVIVDDAGTIVYVGPRGSGARGGATVIDLTGHHLYPGLIAATSSLGLTEIGSVPATIDVNELGPHNARLHAYRAVNPDSELLPVARSGGVTHANVIPGGSLVRGHGGLMKTEGWTWESRLVRGPSGLHLSWPSMALQRGDEAAPMKKQIEERKDRMQALTDLVADARAHLAARRANGAKGAGHTVRDLELEAWQPVLDREIPLMVHADDPRQIEAAIDWCAEHELRMVLVGGRDAHRVAARLAEADIPVIFEDVMSPRRRDFDHVWVGYRSPAALHAAGVEVAISVGSGNDADSIARNLAAHAGMARAHGLPDAAALASVTQAPARILGVADAMGTIEVGKRAHLVVTAGDLLDHRFPVLRMWIDGDEVDLSDRHTRLFERYRHRPGGSTD